MIPLPCLFAVFDFNASVSYMWDNLELKNDLDCRLLILIITGCFYPSKS